jgi:NADPH:quinone reductase-like Zn-dependent oxidoreductase
MHGFAITNATEQELEASADKMNRWMAGGKLKVRIDGVLLLSAPAAAHRSIEDYKSLAGEIVLVP